MEELLAMERYIHPSNPLHSSVISQDDGDAGVLSCVDEKLLHYSTINHPFIFVNEGLPEENHSEQTVAQDGGEIAVFASEPMSPSKREAIVEANDDDIHQEVNESNIVNGLVKVVDNVKDVMESFDNRYETKHESITSNTNDVPTVPKQVKSSNEKYFSSQAVPGAVFNHKVEGYKNGNESLILSVPVRHSQLIESEDIIPQGNRKISKNVEEQDSKDSREKVTESSKDACFDEAGIICNDGHAETIQEEMSPSHFIGADTHLKKLEKLIQNSNDSDSSVQTSGSKSDSKTVISPSKDSELRILGKDADQEKTAEEEKDAEITDTQIYSQRSETDDEKLQMKRTVRHAARSGSISSVSITEHLSQSHSNWTGLRKPRSNNRLNKNSDYKNKRNEICVSGVTRNKEIISGIPELPLKDNTHIDYDSDFEVSDIEGLSISASSLTSTTLPDDLVTPGEEEF